MVKTITFVESMYAEDSANELEDVSTGDISHKDQNNKDNN